MKKCFYCGNECHCPPGQQKCRTWYNLIDPENHEVWFCTFSCLTSQTLVAIEQMHPDLDRTWMPVIKNLRAELDKHASEHLGNNL